MLNGISKWEKNGLTVAKAHRGGGRSSNDNDVMWLAEYPGVSVHGPVTETIRIGIGRAIALKAGLVLADGARRRAVPVFITQGEYRGYLALIVTDEIRGYLPGVNSHRPHANLGLQIPIKVAAPQVHIPRAWGMQYMPHLIDKEGDRVAILAKLPWTHPREKSRAA